MSKRVLAIGVGGSGKASLTILKERLIETYGEVPDNVVLLSLDTDDLRDVDTFAGVSLQPHYDKRGREPEFKHVITPPGITMDTVFADIASGRTAPFMHWLEAGKLSRRLGPAEKDIRGGAQQRRPVGRVALFLKWHDPIYSAIANAITRVYGEPEGERELAKDDIERNKRVIFIVGSVAGGTGSGFIVDIANLVRHAVNSNPNWQSVDVSAIITLPDAFSSYTTAMDDPTNLKPNSYAALRELDRFIRVHDRSLPYMVRYGSDPQQAVTWSTDQPLDHVYLVDTASRSDNPDADLSGNPMRGVFPVIADFMMSHVDDSLGDNLATLRSNAGQHYNKETGRMYSGFNMMTYIFPVADVITSFSYRFLREMMAMQFLPITNNKKAAMVKQGAIKYVESVFTQSTIGRRANPGVIQMAIATTKKVDPEYIDISWPGLFNLITLSDKGFAEDYENIDTSLGYLASYMIASKTGEYRQEPFDEGYGRLQGFGEDFLDEYLGPLTDPDNEESRYNGQWDRILSRYRDALRVRFAEAFDVALLQVLNARDEESPKMLQGARLPFARYMVDALKARLVQFKANLIVEYKELEIDGRLRQTNKDLRDAIAWMYDTKDASGFKLFGKPEAQKAQESYISAMMEKMELALHQRVFRTVIDVLDSLGAGDLDVDKQESIVDKVALELENWQLTMQDADKLLLRWKNRHDNNRKEKRHVKVRHYLTNDEYEKELYVMPEHVGYVFPRVLGQVRGEKGLRWERTDEDYPLSFKLVTTWGEDARGPEDIAQKFFVGVHDLFQVVRNNVTVSDRMAAQFNSPSQFVNTASSINQPFLRYLPTVNDGRDMFHEKYVSFNLDSANEEARAFLERAQSTLGDQGYNIDQVAESKVACTVARLARGVRLLAVNQFAACDSSYRSKLYQGHESLHLFPEEQQATRYEGLIETLNEPDNHQRPLSPEMVITMGDDRAMRAFIKACVYGLIRQDIYEDEDGAPISELFLFTKTKDGKERKLRLSDRGYLERTDPNFEFVGRDGQIHRLYLQALQNFILKAVKKKGVDRRLVPILVASLERRGVSLDNIDNPFTFTIKEIHDTVQEMHLDSYTAIHDHLERFKGDRVEQFKDDSAQRIKDMGTVMHIVIDQEIQELKGRPL